ncbi:MAG: PQQ-binding-like beta-propeller repeat protein [Bacteroidales bacterium]
MRTALFSLLFCLLPALLPAQKESQWRGPDRDGIFPETGLLKSWPAEGPKKLWVYEGLGDGHTSPSIANNLIYITGARGKEGILFVMDLNGKVVKEKPYGEEWTKSYEGSRSFVLVNDGVLYLVTGMGRVMAWDEKTLNPIWEKDMLADFDGRNITWGITESPLVVDEKIILTPGGTQHNVVALNKKTGALIWSSAGEGGKSAYGSPMLVKGHGAPIVVVMTENHILGLDLATGKKNWSVEHKNQYAVHANTPLYSDGLLLCTSGYGKGSVMLKISPDGKSVEKAWENEALDNRIGAMVKLGNYVYGSGDKSRSWFCADWKTGTIQYSEKGFYNGCVMAADGMLYCYSDKGDLALVSPSTEKFDKKGEFVVKEGTAQHWAHPIVHNKVLYIRHGNALIAYDIAAR